jgi:hypothetical protein
VTSDGLVNKPPLPITLIGWLYIAAGGIGFLYHLTDMTAGGPDVCNPLWTEAVRLAAIGCGVFLLRGSTRARWFAVAWMGFHVVISAFHGVPAVLFHLLLLIAIVWFLFHADAGFFGSRQTKGLHITGPPRP